MDRSLLNRILLTLVWMFVVFRAASLCAALFSVYPTDPMFLGFAILVAFAGAAAALTTMGKALGGYVGLLYVVFSVLFSGWLITRSSLAWRASLIRSIVADLLFGFTLWLTLKTNARLGK